MQILLIEGEEAFEEFKDTEKFGKLYDWFKRVKKVFSDKKKASN